MNWEVTTYGVLVLTLCMGFFWFERSAATPQLVGLIAALTALASVGRIVLAALPGVVPTTDIVIIAGYTLGPLPGFLVGALAAFTSNMVLGQGPWTLWQMGAWGLLGVFAGSIASVTGRRVPNWGLLVICAVAAPLFGAIVDFGTWVTFFGTHTWQSYALLRVAALWQDGFHLIGNVTFFLIFGPWLLTALTRLTMRLQVRWIETA